MGIQTGGETILTMRIGHTGLNHCLLWEKIMSGNVIVAEKANQENMP